MSFSDIKKTFTYRKFDFNVGFNILKSFKHLETNEAEDLTE